MPRATPNRERILRAAQDLILSKGFPATTIDEVCERATVTKGGFYYHFASKDQLALAVVDHYFARISAALNEGPHQQLDDPEKRVLAFIDHAIDVASGPMLKDGCILGVLTLDLAETHPDVRARIAHHFHALGSGLEQDLDAVLAASHRKKKLDAGSLARQFLSVLEGSIVLSKAHARPELMAEALTVYRLGLASLLATS